MATILEIRSINLKDGAEHGEIPISGIRCVFHAGPQLQQTYHPVLLLLDQVFHIVLPQTTSRESWRRRIKVSEGLLFWTYWHSPCRLERQLLLMQAWEENSGKCGGAFTVCPIRHYRFCVWYISVSVYTERIVSDPAITLTGREAADQAIPDIS